MSNFLAKYSKSNWGLPRAGRRKRGQCSTDVFFFSSRRRHTSCSRDWSSDVCSSDLCGFACAVAPVVEIDHASRGRVTRDALDPLLAAHPAPHVAAAPRHVAPPPGPTAGAPAARFATLLRAAERRRTGARLAVGLGTCGLAVGARDTFEALRVEVPRRGLPFTAVAAGCNALCCAQPVVEVLRAGR